MILDIFEEPDPRSEIPTWRETGQLECFEELFEDWSAPDANPCPPGPPQQEEPGCNGLEDVTIRIPGNGEPGILKAEGKIDPANLACEDEIRVTVALSGCSGQDELEWQFLVDSFQDLGNPGAGTRHFDDGNGNKLKVKCLPGSQCNIAELDFTIRLPSASACDPCVAIPAPDQYGTDGVKVRFACGEAGTVLELEPGPECILQFRAKGDCRPR